jgi:oligopeptidase B
VHSLAHLCVDFLRSLALAQRIEVKLIVAGEHLVFDHVLTYVCAIMCAAIFEESDQANACLAVFAGAPSDMTVTADEPRKAPAEPRAERRRHVLSKHGVELVDEFAWLKAANWQQVIRDPSRLDPAIRAYLDAENRYTEQILGDTAELQATLYAELKGRIRQDDASVPTADGAFAYFVRYRSGAQHPLVCRHAGAGGADETLLDANALAADHRFFQLGATRHSPDHRLLAWASDDSGSEFYAIRVRDIERATDLADVIPDTVGNVVWRKDAAGFYYVRLDSDHRPSMVFEHRLGTAIEDDRLLYEEADARYFVTLSRLRSGDYAEISVHDHETSESWLIDLHADAAVPRLIAQRTPGIRYDVEHHPHLFGQNALVLRTNADAEDFKLAWTPLASPAHSRWRDLVEHRSGTYLVTFALLRDWLIRLERENGLPRIVVRDLISADEHTISFPEEVYSLAIENGFEFASQTLRFSYSSMTTPTEIWDYDLATRARSLRKRHDIPSGHDPSHYVTRRLMARAADGQTVPLSILYRKDLRPRGRAPCLLYGYGAYGLAVPASFDANRLSLVDRGFVYVIAHVRGGSENGWRWYKDGKLTNKSNSFRDFITAAEYLIAEGWVSREKIVAHGISAGGMLMGAVANLRPDLFAGILAEVPFVDVLNTMLDAELPLTPPEWLEWGDPIADATAFQEIRGYSPYDNVSAQNYPSMLVLAGLMDPRVLYWEPAKWVARLRSRRTNHNLLALRTNMDAGHAGSAGRFERLKDIALCYAFALKVAQP